MSTSPLWERYQQYFLRYEDLGFSMDISRMRFGDSYFDDMAPQIERAFQAMKELEAGAIANPDENRMVGHYWLRMPELAPDSALRDEIEETRNAIEAYAAAIHAGEITAANGSKFTDVLVIGIGGSALGPQFIADSLGTTSDPMRIHFLDNTDPDGIDKVMDTLNSAISTTLSIVISKSGGTKETRNGMLEAKARYEMAGLDFSKHTVAVTGAGSALDKIAESEGWLTRFPMWDWVGGRTSVMSAVGLLPAALQGLNLKEFLAGAAAMDEKTRVPDASQNAAMLLALMWYYAGDGKGSKDMVILPYKDRLVLFSKYLQQLVMESLGKKLDLDGNEVNQGIAVYGNKGSTDQHAYVQQLRDGVPNFFATFIEVLKGRSGDSLEVEDGVTTGDYLQGFLRGTRKALYEGGRDSITISIPDVNGFTVGELIALYERAVGFYATMVNINAYHQPGVEAGKKAAAEVLDLQLKVQKLLSAGPDSEVTAAKVADELGADPEEVYHVLNHLAANVESIRKTSGEGVSADSFVSG
jgi:glucose-6-phosphate isomerase